MNQYMKEADNLAQENLKTNAGGPFGAVVVKDSKIIGKGNNHVLKNNDPTAHAEIMAIRDACLYLGTYHLKDCVLYTSCYPCPMCLSAIIWAGIQKVYYGNTKEDAAEIGFRDDMIYQYLEKLSRKEEQSLLSLIAMDHDETIKTFLKFCSKEDKTIY